MLDESLALQITELALRTIKLENMWLSLVLNSLKPQGEQSLEVVMICQTPELVT